MAHIAEGQEFANIANVSLNQPLRSFREPTNSLPQASPALTGGDDGDICQIAFLHLAPPHLLIGLYFSDSIAAYLSRFRGVGREGEVAGVQVEPEKHDGAGDVPAYVTSPAK